MNIGEPIKSPCEGGKCTSLHDEVRGAAHSRCEKHKKMFDTLSQSKKEEDVRDFVGQFVRHKCGKECTGCSADVDAIIERVRAADRAALVRAVEAHHAVELAELATSNNSDETKRKIGLALDVYKKQLFIVLHSPEK